MTSYRYFLICFVTIYNKTNLSIHLPHTYIHTFFMTQNPSLLVYHQMVAMYPYSPNKDYDYNYYDSV